MATSRGDDGAAKRQRTRARIAVAVLIAVVAVVVVRLLMSDLSRLETVESMVSQGCEDPVRTPGAVVVVMTDDRDESIACEAAIRDALEQFEFTPGDIDLLWAGEGEALANGVRFTVTRFVVGMNPGQDIKVVGVEVADCDVDLGFGLPDTSRDAMGFGGFRSSACDKTFDIDPV